MVRHRRAGALELPQPADPELQREHRRQRARHGLQPPSGAGVGAVAHVGMRRGAELSVGDHLAHKVGRTTFSSPSSNSWENGVGTWERLLQHRQGKALHVL